MESTHDDLRQLLRDMAEGLDCYTEEDFQILAGATPKTVEAWRKRGTGPAYIILGNTYLYPRAGLKEFIKTRVRQPRNAVKVLELL